MKTILSRRDLIRSSVLGSGALLIPHSALALKAALGLATDLQLGIASYTFRNFTRAQMIPMLKQLNVIELNAKDVKDHLPSNPQDEMNALADYAAGGVNIHAAGVISFAKDNEEDIREKFEYAKRSRLPVIVAGDPTSETLPKMENFAKQYDIRVAIHNHGPEDTRWHSPLDVLQAVKDMDPRMGCCVDVGHTVRAGVDVVQAIRTIGARVFNVHMKDLADFQDKESQVAVGNGKMPVRAIFDSLIAIKYSGFVDLEYEVQPNDPLPGVASSLKFMRNVIAGMR